MENVKNILNGGTDTIAIAIFFGLVLPGFISLSVFRQLVPSEKRAFGSSVFEAAAFGAINFILTLPLSFYVYENLDQLRWWKIWGITSILVLITPIIWPFLVRFIVIKGVQIGWLGGFEETGWDAFFAKNEFSFVIVHLKNGGIIGGWFGPSSFASSSPKPGYIYLESLWELDENNAFTGEKIKKSKGIILTPNDYMYIELIEPQEDDCNVES